MKLNGEECERVVSGGCEKLCGMAIQTSQVAEANVCMKNAKNILYGTEIKHYFSFFFFLFNFHQRVFTSASIIDTCTQMNIHILFRRFVFRIFILRFVSVSALALAMALAFLSHF